MKKLIKISLVAMLFATPLIADAANSALPVNFADGISPARPSSVPAPVVANANVATTSYVKGAYNEAIYHLNVVGSELKGDVNTERNRAQAVEGALNDLSDDIGLENKANSNLVQAINKVQDNLNNADSVERERAEAAEAALDERLDVVEAQTLAVFGTWGSDEATDNIRLFPTVTLSPNNSNNPG